MQPFFAGESLEELDVLLNLLPAPQIRILAKEFNVSSKGTQKSDFVASLVKHSKQRSVFFVKGKDNPVASKLRKRCRTFYYFHGRRTMHATQFQGSVDARRLLPLA